MNRGWLRIMAVFVVAIITLGSLNIPLARAPTLSNGQLEYSSVLGGGSRPASSLGVQQLADPIDNIDQFVDTCPTADLQQIQSDFKLSLVGPIANSRPYKCSEPVSQMPASELSDSLLIYQALRLILHMKLYKQLPWTNLHPYEWLRSQITDIQVNDTTPMDQFIYDNKNNNNPTVFLRPLSPHDLYTLRFPAQFMVEHLPGQGGFPRFNVGILGMAQLIMHEARHAVSTGGLHHNCNDSDTNLAYLGAWSVNYYVGSMVAQGQIDVGIGNSVHAGDYILGIIDHQRSIAKSFCAPPTTTSLTAAFSGSSVILGTHPPHFVPVSAHITPKLVAKNIILFLTKGTPTNGPWTAMLLDLGTFVLYDTPFTSGFTDSDGYMEKDWFPNKEGTYCVIAGFAGDGDYSPSLAQEHCGFTVNGATLYSQLWNLTVVSPTSATVSPLEPAKFNLQISGDSKGENVNLAFELYNSSFVGFTVTFSTNNQSAPYESVMTVSVAASKPSGTYDLPFCAGITATPGTHLGLCLGSDIKWRHVTLTVIQWTTEPLEGFTSSGKTPLLSDISGFATELMVAGIAIGLAALILLRRRRRRKPAS